MMKRFLSCLFMILLIAVSGVAESVRVTASHLNGRFKPNKHSTIEALFDCDDVLEITGKWSADHRWIEVVGGESGTVWVSIDYISESVGAYTVQNRDYKSVKVRNKPFDGRITGYLKKGKRIEIDRVVLGWGHCKLGWIDLSLVAEVYGDDD